jgi:hypothetical protein
MSARHKTNLFSHIPSNRTVTVVSAGGFQNTAWDYLWAAAAVVMIDL